DGRVILYWDNVAEGAIDPLTGVNDFEGYKIYRSEDPTFSDVYTITDANGTPFLGKPFQQNGVPAQFDLVNQWSGLHPVEYIGRGIKYQLGSNTGLVHEYVDSSVTNGKNYFYAVVSYDHGFDSLGVTLPPTESQSVITQDPITGELKFDVNTVGVTPGPLPSGVRPAIIDGGSARAERITGNSTGPVTVNVLNPLAVRDGVRYNIDFVSTAGGVRYNVHPQEDVTDRIESRDTVFTFLSKKNIIESSVSVRNAQGGAVPPANYQIDSKEGRIRGTFTGSLVAGASYDVTYQYYAVLESRKMNNEDDNPVFDGLRVYAKNDPLGLDSTNSGWLMVNNTTLTARVQRPASLNQPFTPVPLDFEIRWNATDTLANGKWAAPGDTLLDNLGRRVVVCPFRIVNVTNSEGIRGFVQGSSTDSMWRPNREIIILTPVNPIRTYVGLVFSAPTSGPIILPAAGNVFVAKTTKPFAAGDQYAFSTSAATFDASMAKSALENIYPVPNPYVAFSFLETPGSSATRRGDNRIQFRN
ncbi:MAG: hypothetical protein ACRDGA_06625, partial [Bacteroidota bacterium]